MTSRDFECILCGQPFSRVSSDVILPPDQVCDACLAEIGPLEEGELWAAIDRRRQELAHRQTPLVQGG